MNLHPARSAGTRRGCVPVRNAEDVRRTPTPEQRRLVTRFSSADVATTTVGIGIGPRTLPFATGAQPAVETYVDDQTVAFK